MNAHIVKLVELMKELDSKRIWLLVAAAVVLAIGVRLPEVINAISGLIK